MKKYITASNKNEGTGKILYVVVAGCYSDYYPVGVYSTIEKAQKAVEMKQELRGCDATIERFELNATPD